MIPEQLPDLDEKFSSLISLLREAKEAVLAFSGGVDSSFLLMAMRIADMRMLAVTAISETVPRRDLLVATQTSKKLGVDHQIIETNELMNEHFVSNPPERCFYCKDGLFRRIREIAGERGFSHIFDGSNADDLSDHRPGRRAAALHGVRSPLAECGFSKEGIRMVSKKLGLDTWDRPSSPCLSSRFPYGRRITREALKRVEGAEEVLRSFVNRDVRVRDCGDTARIEVTEEDMGIFLHRETRIILVKELKALGYEFVSLDLEGFRTGSLNRVLKEADRIP